MLKDSSVSKSVWLGLGWVLCRALVNVLFFHSSIIANQSFVLSKSRIEEASDIINNYCSKNRNKSSTDLEIEEKLSDLSLTQVNDEYSGNEEDDCPLTPSMSPALSDSSTYSSQLNVHCVEFVPRSRSVSVSEKVVTSQDVSTMTETTSTVDVTTCTAGLTSTSNASTLTVKNLSDKITQTDAVTFQEEIPSSGIDEEMYEEVLYRAMLAEVCVWLVISCREQN